MTRIISALDIARGLFFTLIFLMWGSRDWIAYHWQESSADTQIKAMAFGTLFAAIVINHLFGNFIFRLFF